VRELPSSGVSGFSLIEVLTALGLLVIAVVSLAHLFALATQANQRSRHVTSAAILAAQKMEQLRSLAWSVDERGQPVSDFSSNVAAFEATGRCAAASAGQARGLAGSPPGALAANTDGYVDYVDVSGCGLGGGAEPPPGAAFARRWSIEPLSTSPNETLILQVRVLRMVGRDAPHGADPTARGTEEARVVTVRTRRPS
jgi:hypothetical protein